MKIAILLPDNNNSESGLSKVEPVCDPGPFLKEFHCDYFYLTKARSVSVLTDIADQGYDLFFNLCDGAEGDDRPGIEVVKYLEMSVLPFTGAKSDFYEPTRDQMVFAGQNCSVPFPAGINIRSLDEISRVCELIRFPLIVKHPNSYSSVGLSRDSVVSNFDELKIITGRIIDLFGGARIEAYISGREFTVLVQENPAEGGEPVVYPPAEVLFPDGETFKHFDLKWIGHDSVKYCLTDDPNLSARLQGLSASLFRGLNGSGYARCDFRMDDENNVYMLEINPNCSVFYPAGNLSSADEILIRTGEGYNRFVSLMVEGAICRKKIFK